MLPASVVDYLYEEYFKDWKIPEHGIQHLADCYRRGNITIDDMCEALDWYNSHNLGPVHDFKTLNIQL
jgi:hypothetical protein